MIETTNQISISRGWTTLYHQRYPCPTGKFHQLSLGNLSSLDQWQIPWKPHGQWLKNVRFPENWPDLVDKEKAIENGHGDSELSHYTWWFSIVFCMFTRGYLKKTRSPNLEKCKKHLKKSPWWWDFLCKVNLFPCLQCIVALSPRNCSTPWLRETWIRSGVAQKRQSNDDIYLLTFERWKVTLWLFNIAMV